MEAIKKQAIKLREQVAKQQQAVLKHLLHLGIENVALKLSVTNNFKIYTIPPGQLRHHPPLANNKTLFDIDLLWLLTEVASIYQTELNRESWPKIVASMERRIKVSEPLRALINGAPLEDARHLTHRYDKLRHEVEAQAAEVFRRRSKIRESDISAESAVKLRNAEARLTELKSTIMALGREATAAMLSVESQQQQMTYQRLFAMVIHPFDAQANGELSLSIDDYVVVRQVAPTGWSEGECKGQAGWFPSAYVERQEKAPASKISEANSSPECDATS
ncbi:hypothetical protein CUMW_149480 [Citrus unshiu]|nr:hypothetical protein CUMW_149480 [Citrus unshiu]